MAELVKSQVDVILVNGDAAIRAAQKATTTIPILAGSDDMVGAGLVNSLARPGGNTTGVSILATELDGKRQEILIEAVPGLRRMAALADSNRTPVVKLDALQEAARTRNIELSVHRVASGAEITAAIDMARASGAVALNVLSSPILYASRQLIMDRVAALRLPSHVSMARRGRGRRFSRLRPTSHPNLSRASDRASRQAPCAASSLPTSRSSSRPSSSW